MFAGIERSYLKGASSEKNYFCMATTDLVWGKIVDYLKRTRSMVVCQTFSTLKS
jgi:hypothetical protein